MRAASFLDHVFKISFSTVVEACCRFQNVGFGSFVHHLFRRFVLPGFLQHLVLNQTSVLVDEFSSTQHQREKTMPRLTVET